MNNYKVKLTAITIAIVLFLSSCSNNIQKNNTENPESPSVVTENTELSNTTYEPEVETSLPELEVSAPAIEQNGIALSSGDTINNERRSFKDVDTGLYGITDKSGNVIIEPVYEKLEMFVFGENIENLIIVGHQSEKLYLLDQNGERYIDISFESFGLNSSEFGFDIFIASDGEFNYWMSFDCESGRGIEAGIFGVSFIDTKMLFGEFMSEVLMFPHTITVVNNRFVQDFSEINSNLILAKQAVEHFFLLNYDYNLAISRMVVPEVDIDDFDEFGVIVSLFNVVVWAPGTGRLFCEITRQRYYREVTFMIEYSNLPEPKRFGIGFQKNSNGEYEIFNVFRGW
ncbi:MAG: hypothetical protein FWF76_02835 [Oscillospiraceae bacterium]|nr:hypothetical protein [Oscillospiraceae bacterium]